MHSSRLGSRVLWKLGLRGGRGDGVRSVRPRHPEAHAGAPGPVTLRQHNAHGAWPIILPPTESVFFFLKKSTRLIRGVGWGRMRCKYHLGSKGRRGHARGWPPSLISRCPGPHGHLTAAEVPSAVQVLTRGRKGPLKLRHPSQVSVWEPFHKPGPTVLLLRSETRPPPPEEGGRGHSAARADRGNSDRKRR